jgi:hypothetical protein
MWFSIFVITKFNDKCWKNNFRMSKHMLFDRTHQFNIHIKKEDTTYRLAIHVEVWVACTIYKLEFSTRCKFIFMFQIISNMQICCWFNCTQGDQKYNHNV